MQHEIRQFLQQKTDGVGHSGRSFLEHLEGTHDLLAGAGAAPYVCLAGLFHSVYGTNVFRHEAVPMTDRDQVIALIGAEAEHLAHVFCSCQRPRALVEAAERGPPYQVVNWRDGKPIALSPRDLADLLDIEAANLEEQNGLAYLPRVQAARQRIEMVEA